MIDSNIKAADLAPLQLVRKKVTKAMVLDVEVVELIDALAEKNSTSFSKIARHLLIEGIKSLREGASDDAEK